MKAQPMLRCRYLPLLFISLLLSACYPDPRKSPVAEAPLRLVVRPADDACAYVSAAGDTVIPFGRYLMSATNRFDKLALVLKPGLGWVGIDRQERVLFRAYVFDNGPDYPAEGVMRMVNAAGRIGYADTATGRVLLPPRYEAAYPFANGRARVGIRCQALRDGEHSVWSCGQWQLIDHQGRVLPDSAAGAVFD